MKVLEYISKNAVETARIAGNFAHSLQGDEVILLSGDIGAGKTVFAKGVALGLGINDQITSPTFNFVNLYTSKSTLAHFDFYRLDNPEDIYELGLLSTLQTPSVRLIEWSENIKQFLPKTNFIEISIEKLDENSRKIIIAYK